MLLTPREKDKLLIAMAALNIITTLTMTVIEKHRDIAILRAQGATPRAIN